MTGHFASRLLLGTLLSITLAGCSVGNNNGDSRYLRLSGDVTLGQHLLDLKKAMDAGALNEEEFNLLKGTILKLAEGTCAADE